MNDYLAKPIEPPRLAAVLGQWLTPTPPAGSEMGTPEPRPPPQKHSLFSMRQNCWIASWVTNPVPATSSMGF